MSNTFYTAYFKHQALSRINGSLRCYDGSPITPRGSCSLSVTYRGRTKQIKFYIIDNGCHVQPAPILGRDFMSEFNLGISEMKYIDNPVIEETSVAKILMNKFPAVFSNKLGKLNKFKVQLQLKPDAKPIFFKPRPVPFALKPKVDEALDKLIETGILKSVNYSDYATPITPVLKSDGTVRVCGDYSVTLNKVLHIDRYPLPRIEELFARLHEGKEFSKLDLSMAYMQLELTEDSQPLTCINTHRGLFQFTRLVFGLSSAPAIFQKTMERILAGIEGICIFLDDFLISGRNKDTHRKRLNEVLNRLQEAGPFARFAKMGAKWMWSEAHQSAFETVKRALESELALAHYDPRLSTVLTVDASPTGLGRVGAAAGGRLREVAFASRALTPSERVYSQIQKEATAIIFGVKKFHQYLYGRADPFVLKTDHKPLLSIFGNKKGIPEMTANRLQRYALFLSAYNYTVQYVRSANNVADYLSRSHPQARAAADGSGAGTCAASVDVEDGEINSYLHFISSNDQSSITIKEIKVETQNDPMLHSVVNFIRNDATSRAQWARAARATVGTRSFGYAKCGHIYARQGGTHLVVVDAHSKWVEWAPLADGAGTEPVLRRLSEMLGRFGLPRTIVTDNATPFTSARFRRYCEYDWCLSGAVDARPERAYEARLVVSTITGVVSTYSRTNSVSKETRRSVITLARWRRRLHSGHPQAAYEHYNSDESDDDYTFVKCSPMLMTERGRRKSKPRQHEARIVRTKGSLPKIAARS
ncbi:Uncharacterized protein K02A2.6 [Eumeta japonica]|uniref:Uncharacterized protein K02A2.6 n=1 Tax=Eumeta variegata TaxID=151549 RepID=A0A4C1X962_EUMVA|nr:Uncharacterized protein K02A2.6 [Eumeta japonica]